MCAKAKKPIVLMIDEVDSASNNQVFIDFLAQLRMYYINRDKSPIFHSVILAGVYDIKNMFMAKEAINSDVYAQGGSGRIGFIKDNMLDMTLVLKKFAAYFTEICGQNDQNFIEKQGRKIFLIYLKSIINSIGNYYIEAQTRDERRTDIIVDYLGEQFIVELKIWHGSEYNERGEKQLTEYLDNYHKDKGYLLSFNFNKNKETGVKEIQIGNQVIVEAVV